MHTGCKSVAKVVCISILHNRHITEAITNITDFGCYLAHIVIFGGYNNKR